MRCCASETVSAGHVGMLFSGFPGTLFLCDPIASGAFRGLLPSKSLFVILANTRSIFDITSWREIGSAVMAPLPVELGGLPNSSLARGQKLAPVCQSMRSYVTRRKHKSDARAASPETVAGVDRACTLRISRMSPDIVVMRDQKSPLAGRGVSLTRVHAWCLCGA